MKISSAYSAQAESRAASGEFVSPAAHGKMKWRRGFAPVQRAIA